MPSLDEVRPITDAELLSLLVQLLVGGNETTTSLITNLMWRLLGRPELWRAVVADPSLVEVAVEESLRTDPPVLGLYRTTTSAVCVADDAIAADTKVMLLWASANRDESVWQHAEDFRLDRDLTEVRRHSLSFGFGSHVCPGAPLARLEARLVLDALVRRAPTLALAGEPERIEPFFLWGRRRLPVQW
jgi:cytochrome P450